MSNGEQTLNKYCQELGSRPSLLEGIIDEFRSGGRSHVDSVAAILRELESEPLLPEKEKDATFKLFNSEIHSIEDRLGSGASGSEPTRGLDNRVEDLAEDVVGKGKEKAIPSTRVLPGDSIELLEQLSKRSISEGPDTDDDGGNTHKKKRLLESDISKTHSFLRIP